MTALRNLTNTNSDMSVNVSRLSTGLRINNASDDAAGLVISESMRAQIKGIGQAMMNSQDAVNMTKTAEGGMDEIQRLLRDIRSIAVHAANAAVVDGAQLQADQSSINSTLQSVDRIAQSTQWGTRKLLNGTAGSQANVTATSDINGTHFTGTFANQQIGSGTITMTKITEATQTTLVTDKTYASASTVVSAGSVVINGYTFAANGTSDTVQDMVNKINLQSSNTGVIAQVDTSSGSAQMKLQSLEYGSQFPINYFDGTGMFSTTANPAPTTVGVDAVVDVTAPVIGPNGPTTATVRFTGGRGPGDSGLKLSDTNGNSITLTSSGNANTALTAATAVGTLTSGNVRFQIGANADQSVSFALPDVRTSQLGSAAVLGKTLQDLDVTTQQGATDAIKIIDAAISQLSTVRGQLGSFQKNFLESTVRSLSVASENLTASESSIRDLDVASEMTSYTKNQVLQQSGIAILAQANQAPNQILKLIGG